MSARAMRWAEGILRGTKLPPAEASVLMLLAWKHEDKTGECFPSLETLSVLSGYGIKTVRHARACLRARGLIKTFSRRIGGHQGSDGHILFGRLNVKAKLPARPPKGVKKAHPSLPPGVSLADYPTQQSGSLPPGVSLADCPPGVDDRGNSSSEVVTPFRKRGEAGR